MTNAKRLCSLILCALMIVSTMCALILPASAAKRGNSRAAVITVSTKANYWVPGSSSITLQQSKQTMTCEQLFGGTKTKTKTGYYGHYEIEVRNITRNTTKDISWSGGKTKKINLDPNCVYKITVQYNSGYTLWFNNAPWGYSIDRFSTPSWSVKSTWKVSSYY